MKVKFYRKLLFEGETNLFITKPGHVTKMADMSIYGNIPSKSSQELLNLLQLHLTCSN